MNTPNELQQVMEENKKLKLELEKVNSSFKAKPEGFFSRILNTVDGVLSGFRNYLNNNFLNLLPYPS